MEKLIKVIKRIAPLIPILGIFLAAFLWDNGEEGTPFVPAPLEIPGIFLSSVIIQTASFWYVLSLLI